MLKNFLKNLREQVKVETSQQKKADLLKRLRVIEAFKAEECKS